jgi:hypothetical protein
VSNSDTSLHELGWRITVDTTEGNLYLEHAETDTTYVLDADGGLQLAGEPDIEDGLDALRETLAAVDNGDTEVEAGQTALTDGGSAANCTLECDENTGEVTIESDTRITLDAPVIEMSSQGQMSLQASGVLSLNGALIQLN